MNRFVLVILFLFCLSLQAKDAYILRERVTDETGTLSKEFHSYLEEKLAKYESQTTNQIVVLVIESLEGDSIEDFSIRMAEKNQIGQKNYDNGVLLTIAKSDRKLRIEVGYGLEGQLTDVLCNRIIRSEITPYFKKDDFEKGIDTGINSIIGGIGGTYTLPKSIVDPYLGPLHDHPFIQSLREADLAGSHEALPLPIKIFVTVFVLFVLGVFTHAAIITPYMGWFIYFFLFPFWSIFPIVIHGFDIGVITFLCYSIGVVLIKLVLLLTPWGRKKMKSFDRIGSGSSGSGSSRSSSSSFGGRSSGGFSGGGGSFGGGGSSGSW